MRFPLTIAQIIVWSIGSGITAGIVFRRSPETSFHTRSSGYGNKESKQLRAELEQNTLP